MITTNTLPSNKNSYDTVFLIGLITIMLIVVVSFLIIQFLISGGVNTSLNKEIYLPAPDLGIIEEQV